MTTETTTAGRYTHVALNRKGDAAGWFRSAADAEAFVAAATFGPYEIREVPSLAALVKARG